MSGKILSFRDLDVYKMSFELQQEIFEMHDNRAHARQHDYQTKILLSAIFKVSPSSVIRLPSSAIETQILFNRYRRSPTYQLS